MSLMSELEDLGELMADNLVTMGVTDATASDGLTTLANRILDIEQGGGGCIMIDLATDKSILSYYHRETATLTATVRQDGVLKSGESVQFYIDDVAWGSPVTTNASGVATKTYSANADENITIKAECRYASETCTIEDKYLYISTDVDRSSTFDIYNSGASYTQSIENDCYKFTKANDSQEKGLTINFANISQLQSYEVEMIVKWSTSNQGSYNNIFKMADTHTGQVNSLHCGTWSTSKVLGYIKNGTNHRYNPSGRLTHEIWYKYTARYNHQTGEIYTSIYNLDSGTLVLENTQTDTFSTIPTYINLSILLASSSNWVKSIKARAL